MKIDYTQNTLIITLYDKENVYHIWNTIEEMERMLCKKLSIDEDDFDELGEIEHAFAVTVQKYVINRCVIRYQW